MLASCLGFFCFFRQCLRNSAIPANAMLVGLDRIANKTLHGTLRILCRAADLVWLQLECHHAISTASELGPGLREDYVQTLALHAATTALKQKEHASATLATLALSVNSRWITPSAPVSQVSVDHNAKHKLVPEMVFTSRKPQEKLFANAKTVSNSRMEPTANGTCAI